MAIAYTYDELRQAMRDIDPDNTSKAKLNAAVQDMRIMRVNGGCYVFTDSGMAWIDKLMAAARECNTPAQELNIKPHGATISDSILILETTINGCLQELKNIKSRL